MPARKVIISSSLCRVLCDSDDDFMKEGAQAAAQAADEDSAGEAVDCEENVFKRFERPAERQPRSSGRARTKAGRIAGTLSEKLRTGGGNVCLCLS